jgi:AmmeMemoRadiSam system protein B
VAPHAGWEFSGALALAVFSRIPRTIDTMVIIGGHLGPADGILAAFEEGYETPEGVIDADTELLEALRPRCHVREDRSADNTVEIQLPFVRHLFPGVKALGMRAAPSEEAFALGEVLAEVSRQAGRRIAVVGSTDLTHYGPNYGFLPKGTGERALGWVRDVNDRRFIDSLLALDAEGARERSLRERSACSAGGALAAMGFARASGCAGGVLVKYMTSRDVYPGESFVGYAAVVYPAPG